MDLRLPQAGPHQGTLRLQRDAAVTATAAIAAAAFITVIEVMQLQVYMDAAHNVAAAVVTLGAARRTTFQRHHREGAADRRRRTPVQQPHQSDGHDGHGHCRRSRRSRFAVIVAACRRRNLHGNGEAAHVAQVAGQVRGPGAESVGQAGLVVRGGRRQTPSGAWRRRQRQLKHLSDRIAPPGNPSF